VVIKLKILVFSNSGTNEILEKAKNQQQTVKRKPKNRKKIGHKIYIRALC
jgi:hypothetical protein